MPKFLNALLFVAACVYLSCKKEAPLPGGDDSLSELNLPAEPYNYAVAVNLPDHFKINAPGPLQTSVNGLDNAPLDNPVTDHGATLGRVLFYDKKLSANGRVSCASCHVQEAGFSDPQKLSKGFEGGLTRRHSMTLVNARFYQRGRFFWDERAVTLEQQVLQPFQDPVEMGVSLGELVRRVEEQPYYQRLFKNAFGDESVSADRIARAWLNSCEASSATKVATTLAGRRFPILTPLFLTSRRRKIRANNCSYSPFRTVAPDASPAIRQRLLSAPMSARRTTD